MSVLCFEDFLVKPPYSDAHTRYVNMKDYQEWFDIRPFFNYCSEFWSFHYRSSAEMAKPGMLKKIRQLCNPESMYFRNWFPLLKETTFVGPCSDLLQVSSLLGIDALVIEILDEISENEAQKSVCDGALLFAASAGRRDTMALLLCKGANVDICDEILEFPVLHRAVYSGNAKAVELLLNMVPISTH